MSSSGTVWRALAGAVLVVSCVDAPSAGPTSIAVVPSRSPATSPSDGPSDGPTPVPGAQAIGADWELVHTFGKGSVADIARGPDGWVAGGTARCREQGCGRTVAATWFSTDGVTWTGGPIPVGRQSGIHSVATDGDRWFAAGYGSQGRGETFRQEALFWRSLDGREWEPVGSMPLDLPGKGIGPIGELAAGAGGVILTYFDPVDPEPLAVYWSESGEAWLPVDRAALDLPEDGSVPSWTATVANDRLVLLGACGDCGTVWSSRNGRDWTLDATLGENSTGLAIGSDGRRVVAVVVDEDCEAECRLGIWVSENGRTGWTPAPQLFHVSEPYVTFAGGRFILSASIEDNDDPGQGVHIYTSPDGLSWTEFVEPEFRIGECYTGGLEGAKDRVVFLGTNDCEGIWVSIAP